MLTALGIAAAEHGHRVRYSNDADLVETLYRGLADNSVGRVIDTLLHNNLVIVDELGFAPLDDTGAQLLFRFVAAAYERRSLGIGSHWPFESWGRFLPGPHRDQPARPGSCTTATPSSPTATPTP
jgi:DNA replication protein DnaC